MKYCRKQAGEYKDQADIQLDGGVTGRMCAKVSRVRKSINKSINQSPVVIVQYRGYHRQSVLTVGWRRCVIITPE